MINYGVRKAGTNEYLCRGVTLEKAKRFAIWNSSLAPLEVVKIDSAGQVEVIGRTEFTPTLKREEP